MNAGRPVRSSRLGEWRLPNVSPAWRHDRTYRSRKGRLAADGGAG